MIFSSSPITFPVTDPIAGNWENVSSIDISSYLKEGSNTISIVAQNESGPAGLLAKISFDNGSTLVTDTSWTTLDGITPVTTTSASSKQAWTGNQTFIRFCNNT